MLSLSENSTTPSSIRQSAMSDVTLGRAAWPLATQKITEPQPTPAACRRPVRNRRVGQWLLIANARGTAAAIRRSPSIEARAAGVSRGTARRETGRSARPTTPSRQFAIRRLGVHHQGQARSAGEALEGRRQFAQGLLAAADAPAGRDERRGIGARGDSERVEIGHPGRPGAPAAAAVAGAGNRSRHAGGPRSRHSVSTSSSLQSRCDRARTSTNGAWRRLRPPLAVGSRPDCRTETDYRPRRIAGARVVARPSSSSCENSSGSDSGWGAASARPRRAQPVFDRRRPASRARPAAIAFGDEIVAAPGSWLAAFLAIAGQRRAKAATSSGRELRSLPMKQMRRGQQSTRADGPPARRAHGARPATTRQGRSAP